MEEKQCLQCTIQFKPKKTRNIFCCRSCAAKNRNINMSAETRLKKNENIRTALAKKLPCVGCNMLFYAKGRKYCPECRKLHLLGSRLKSEADRKTIAKHARQQIRHKPQICAICNYSLHVQCAHIKPVAEFEGTALLSEINALPNLVLLCPTHHWEYDNGFIHKDLLVGVEGFEPPYRCNPQLNRL